MRTALAQEADALLMKNAACVPLYYDEVIRVHSKNLKGLKDQCAQCSFAQRGYSSIGALMVVTNG